MARAAVAGVVPEQAKRIALRTLRPACSHSAAKGSPCLRADVDEAKSRWLKYVGRIREPKERLSPFLSREG